MQEGGGVAARLFYAAGGDALRDCRGNATPELEQWERAFVAVAARALAENARRRLDSAVEDGDGTIANRVTVRKKDEPTDAASNAAMRTAQAVQAALVAKRAAGAGMRHAITVADHATLDAPMVWRAPPHRVPKDGHGHDDDDDDDANAAPSLYQSVYPHRAKHARRRVVVDGALPEELCRSLAGICVVALHAADAPARGGEAHVRADDPGALAMLCGTDDAADASQSALDAVAAAVAHHFDEPPDRLRVSGALLTRLEPPPAGTDYDYTRRHIDKANVRSYDYSALVYLNDQATGEPAHAGEFAGGSFRFVDAACDEVVAPRRSRLVAFPSGADHLHAVDAVERGHRFVLAVWLTLAGAAAAAAPALTPALPSSALPAADELSQVHGAVEAKIAAMVRELGLSDAQVRALEHAALSRGARR